MTRRARLRLAAFQWNAPLVAALIATVTCVGLFGLHRAGVLSLPWLDDAEASLVDARFRARGARAPVGDDIVIVALDDDTRARAPDLFQKRAGWARLIDALASYQPAAVGVDAFWSAPEIVLPDAVVAKARDARAALDALPAEKRGAESDAAAAALDAVLAETRGDETLARAVSRAGVVYLGVLFVLEGPPAPPAFAEPPGLAAARYGDAVNGPAPRSRRPAAASTRLVVSRPEIAQGAAGAGFVNVLTDDDGGVRRVYAVIDRGGRFYAPLGLELARARLGGGADLAYVVGDDRVGLGDKLLPVDRRGRAWLDFLGPGGTFSTISAADVVEHKVPPARLAGKLVFVGLTDVARDTVRTPFDPLFPGVELHATLAYDALHGELMTAAGPFTTVLAMLALGGLVAALQLRVVRSRGAWLVIVPAAAALVVFLAGAYWLFSAHRLIVDVAAPVASLVIVALASLSAGLVVEGREKLRIKHAFAQYLDDRAVAQILADPARLRLGGERRELTVLFSDIRGFSLFSEQLDPQQLSTFLNEYLTPMTDLVLEAGGLLDKYIGDAVMAVFGAPLEQGDHAARACRTALAMQRRLVELNRGFAARGLPEIAIGIGVSSGGMSVGNMGSERRFDYTVVGDAVNLGARLEALTKEYGARVLVGERVVALAGDGFVFREIDTVRVKGKDRVERVFELLGERGAAPAVDQARYAAALAAYRARRFADAQAELDAALAAHPDDGPARALRERAARLAASPPPAEWDGVYEQARK